MKKKSKTERKKQQGNLPIIIAAFILSIVIWFSISLSDQFYVTISLPLKIVNIPTGNSIGNKIPETINIRIKSHGWRILAIRNISNPVFTASVSSDAGALGINLKSALSENTWLTSDVQVLDIYPESIPLSIERTYTQMKKIVSNMTFSFNDGYGLARPPVFTPDSILVFGTKKNLDRLEFVSTAKKHFEHLDKEFTTNIQLERIPGIVFQTNSVECFFDIQKIVDREIENIPVEVRDVPPDRKVVLTPGQITIGIHGGIELLGRIRNEDFKAYISYEDILSDTLGFLEPNVIFPSHIEKIYLKPKFVKPIIKKY